MENEKELKSTPIGGGEENLNSSSRTSVSTLAESSDYVFDGKWGPIPNKDGTVDLSDYAGNYIANYLDITELPEENKKYLDEVLTTGKYKVVNMYEMFYNCNSLTSLDVSNWDTSNVTDMSSMFFHCSDLISLDVTNFDTSNVTDMSSMFSYCNSLTSLDLSNWDTSNVTDMSYMFRACNKLTSLDLSNWDTSNVTDMSYMFTYCNSLTSLDFGILVM